jgi:outer membrane receptor protein involved in Fe transport
MIDGLSMIIGFTAKKAAEPAVIAVTTTNPDRTFTLDTGGVSLAPGDPQDAAQASMVLPAEAFVRLVYGRVDDDAELTAAGVTLPELQAIFPGF